MDVNSFFYEVTTRICGSLNLGDAAFNTFEYMRTVLPLSELAISLFDYKRESYRVITKANANGGELLDEWHVLPDEAVSMIMRYDHTRTKTVDAAKDPVISFLFDTAGFRDSQCIIMPLNLKTDFLGVAIFFMDGKRIFSPEDIELISVVNKPFGIALSNCLEHLELERLRAKAEEENVHLRKKIAGDMTVIGENSGLKGVLEMVKLVAPLSSPVMLLGETGTGKEIIAGAIHQASTRRDRPFIKMNCGAIPEALADSELFGHERGAFTGATSKRLGRFERADHGTLLLDEIGELSPDIQVKLLRVIQEHEIERVGGVEPIPVDVRIICATHKDLIGMAAENKFREDLLYRLNVFPIVIPPLRHRRQDIPELANYFLIKKSHEMGMRCVPVIAEEDMEGLCGYDWPGNVRELQNIVERALIFRKGNRLDFLSLLPHADSSGDIASMDDSMARVIREALARAGGKISGAGGAAAQLGINPSTLRSRIKKLGITVK